MDPRGAHVLITGGSKGIGAAMARELGRRGARLTLVARASDELEKVAVDVGAVALTADLSDLGNVEGLVARATEANGPIDVLINNAALGMSRHFGMLSADDVRQCMTTNLLAPMELSRQVLVGMLERDRGTIANISSVAGELAVPHLACYSASKAGLMTFSLDLQRDLKRTNIAVMVFVLGAVPGTQIYHESLQNEVIHAIAQRLEKVSKITPDRVARRVADTIADEKRRAVVTIPGSSAPLIWCRHIPVRLADRFFASVDHPHREAWNPSPPPWGLPPHRPTESGRPAPTVGATPRE